MLYYVIVIMSYNIILLFYDMLKRLLHECMLRCKYVKRSNQNSSFSDDINPLDVKLHCPTERV